MARAVGRQQPLVEQNSLRDIGTKRASDSILDELRRMIVMLELKPGAVFTEAELGNILDCSRTPLREALFRLERERLINRTPHRGLSIAEVSMADLGPLLEAAVGVSGVIAEVATARLTPEKTATLERILAQAKEANVIGDLPAMTSYHFEFHHVLAEVTGNIFLVEIQDMLQRLTDRFVILALYRVNEFVDALSDHTPILDALKTKDPQRAVEVMRWHWNTCRERARQAF